MSHPSGLLILNSIGQYFSAERNGRYIHTPSKKGGDVVSRVSS
jgi:hypothetical protein